MSKGCGVGGKEAEVETTRGGSCKKKGTRQKVTGWGRRGPRNQKYRRHRRSKRW